MRRLPPTDVPITNVLDMAAKKKPAPYSRPRKSRDEGALALLDATVALLYEKSPDHVTTADIAERAGLNRAHIVRYFGNRNEMLASAVEHNINRMFSQSPPPPFPDLLNRGQELQDSIQWYVSTVSYLLTSGVPPERFHFVQQQIADRAQTFFNIPNASPHLRSTLVNIAILLMQSTAFFGDLNQLSSAEKRDILLTMTRIAAVAPELDKAIGWKNEADS